MGHAGGRLRQHTLFKSRPDQCGQRAESRARVELLDRRPARARGRAAGCRRRDVRPHALPKLCLCPRPQS